MFFVLSKVVAFFLSPFYWVLLMLIGSFLVRKAVWRKRLRIIGLFILLIFSNEVIYNLCVNAWQVQPVQLPSTARYSAGIVLGGYASFNKDDRGYFNEAADRFIQVLRLYKTGQISRIVVTGSTIEEGKTEEADFVKEELLTMGVQPADILIENKSKNTFQNAVYTKRLLAQSGARPPYLLVSSAMHLPRAALVFKKAGLPIIPYPANFTVAKKTFHLVDYIVPKGDVLTSWPIFLKEIVGLLGYKLFGRA